MIKPARHSAPWTAEENAELISHNTTLSYDLRVALSNKYQRTIGGIYQRWLELKPSRLVSICFDEEKLPKKRKMETPPAQPPILDDFPAYRKLFIDNRCEMQTTIESYKEAAVLLEAEVTTSREKIATLRAQLEMLDELMKPL